ncbi:MAG: hypothetical protein Crog4KO_19130 [Crocinitomicaceae bacterium]
MKAIILFVCLATIVACTPEPTTMYATSVMVDVTEEDGYRPTKEEVSKYAELNDRSDGKRFSLVPITDLKSNTHFGVSIDPAYLGMNYDEMSRKSDLEKYVTRVDSLLIQLDSFQYGRDHSAVFPAVLDEAREIMSYKADERRIIIYSDLDENNAKFSLSNRAHKKLIGDPEALRLHFESVYGVTETDSFRGLVIEIHHVSTYQKETHFMVYMDLYKAVFESRGATVKHQLLSIKTASS